MEITGNKTCRKCRQCLAVDRFSPSPSNRDRLRTDCRTCQSAYMAAYRIRNANHLSDLNREWRQRNAQELKVKAAANYKKDAERIKAKSLANYYKDTERVKARVSAWAKRFPQKRKEYVARCYQKNRAEYSEAGKQRMARERSSMSDFYMKILLSQHVLPEGKRIPLHAIPKQLIPLARAHLTIHRYIKDNIK